VTVDELLEKLDTIFGRVATFDTLMQDFYKMTQEKNEPVALFATRIEGVLARIRKVHGTKVPKHSIEGHLRDRLFHGMRKALRDSIRFLYEGQDASFSQLLLAARRAETENPETKVKVNAVQGAADVQAIVPTPTAGPPGDWGAQLAEVLKALAKGQEKGPRSGGWTW
jgi:hypothetical protein